MKTSKVRAMASVLAVSLFLFQTAGFFPADANTDNSATYLQAHKNNPWVTMALAAMGQTPDTEYLKNLDRVSATDYESSILALTAVGQNPSAYPNEDLVAKLRTYGQERQIGDPKLLNDDFFGVLSLISAGISSSDPLVTDAAQFIITHQLSNGGWGYAVDAGSDTNSTAAAVMALVAYGMPSSDPVIAKAIAYLKSAQNTDGGFPYDPSQSFSSSSDSSSDAWVISALYAIGEKPSLTHLQSLIDETGYAHYMPDDNPTSFTPTATAYAVVALAGKYYPVNKLAAPQPVGASVDYFIKGSSQTLCAGTLQAVTALDVVKNAALACEFTYAIKDTSFGAYVQQIGNNSASGSSGWLYAVNHKKPSVGAGDYTLTTNDSVVWFFGSFDTFIPEMPQTTGIDLSATIAPLDILEDSIGFEVDARSLSFGQLKPGTIGQAKFNLRNIGSQPIQIAGVVTGDELFRNYLKIANLPWRQFLLSLGANQDSIVQTKLPVPATYALSGEKSGILTFWATPAN